MPTPQDQKKPEAVATQVGDALQGTFWATAALYGEPYAAIMLRLACGKVHQACQREAQAEQHNGQGADDPTTND